MRKTTTLQTSVRRIALPVAVSALAGAIGGFLVDLGLGIGYGVGHGALALVCAGFYGLALGDLIMRACGRELNLKLATVAALGLAFGAIGGRMLVGCHILYSVGWSNSTGDYCRQMLISALSPMMLASLFVAVLMTVRRIRVLQRSIA
ncbi:MAG: hypothetical protein Q7T82_06415 [Armatimonadota bacterium]|nr:hypothetical protein [Armatimonadota bacterium]